MEPPSQRQVDDEYLCNADERDIQNAEWVAFFEAQIKSLRVYNGQEAMKLLLHSERVK